MFAFDDVVAFGASGAAVGLAGVFAHKMLRQPEAMLGEYGYNSADKEALYPLVVSLLRYTGCAYIAFCLITVYLMTLSIFYTGLWQTTVGFALIWNAGSLAVSSYRAYYEDPKSARNSETSIAAAKKNVKIVGAVVGLLLFAEFMLWWYYPKAGQNFVNDAYKGLPDDLSLVKEKVKAFLQRHQTVLGF